MSHEEPITNQILKTLRRHPVCEFDALAADCSEFTWNQVFLEVDRLSRLGQLCLTSIGDGNYFIRLPHKEEKHEPEPVSDKRRKDAYRDRHSSRTSGVEN